MLIKKIKLENIRSYVKQEIEFPKGSILLSGNIGAGKTTVLLAVEFALFGLQRGIIDGAALLRNGTNKGSVELEIEINRKKIKLKRTLKRKKDSIVQDNAVLEKNGEEKELSVTELKAFVLNTLNYPPQLLKKQNLIYRYTVYTPQEQMKYILLSKSEERIDIIRKIFNIDKYKRIEDSCNIFISKIRELSKLKEGQLSDMDFKRNELAKKKASFVEIEKELEKILPKFEKIQQEIKEIKKENEELQSGLKKFNELKQDLAKDETELHEKQEQLGDFRESFERIEKMVLKLKKEVEIKIDVNLIGKKDMFEQAYDKKSEEERRCGKEISGFLAVKARLESDNKKISSLKICPVCKQEVSEEHRKKINGEINTEIKRLDKNIKEKEKIVHDLNEQIEDLEKKFKEITEKERIFEGLKVKSSTLKEKQKEKEELTKKITWLERKVDELRATKQQIKDEIFKYENFENNKKKIDRELMEKLEEEKEVIQEKASFEKGKKDVEIEVKELEQEIKSKEKVAEDLQKISELRDWLSKQFILVMQQIEKQVMYKLNLEFNLLFKKWFSMLVEDALEARIDIDFTPFVEQSGYDISYAYLSGGERTALALAYRLSLNQVINSMLSKISTRSILILDEPTEGFSSEQLDKMREVLKEIKVEQLILVSHESKVESFVDNVINFIKKANETEVQQNI